MHKLLLLLAATATLATAACNNETSSNTSKATADTTNAPAKEITLTDFPPSPGFPDARLAITSMSSVKAGDSAKLSFAFDVKGYDLKAQTGDAHDKLCNNSDKGQHIHFILDNKPYVALYEPKHETTVPLSSEHYLLCFLSRSYHESVKDKGAMAMVHFKIDADGKMQKLEAPAMPMLFYSRPKGDYLGKDIENVLLDFYPVNAALGGDYKVKADVKNESTGKTASFMMDQWKAHFLQGLGTGKASVTLTLVGKDGQPIAGPMSTVTRNINLSTSEPMKP